jgi:hypothetical protein
VSWTFIGQVFVTALAVSIAGFFGVIAARACIRNFRDFRKGLGRPLILAFPADLDTLKSTWPVDRKRWPDPTDYEGGRMQPKLALVYARLAARTASRHRMISFSLTILGGAFLGVQLPDIYRALADAATEIGHEAMAESRPIDASGYLQAAGDSWRISLVATARIASLFVIYVGLIYTQNSEWFERMQVAYTVAAKPAEPAPVPPKGWLRRFIG